MPRPGIPRNPPSIHIGERIDRIPGYRDVVTSYEPTNGPWGRKLRESAKTGRLSIDEELDLFLRERRYSLQRCRGIVLGISGVTSTPGASS